MDGAIRKFAERAERRDEIMIDERYINTSLETNGHWYWMLQFIFYSHNWEKKFSLTRDLPLEVKLTSPESQEKDARQQPNVKKT